MLSPVGVLFVLVSDTPDLGFSQFRDPRAFGNAAVHKNSARTGVEHEFGLGSVQSHRQAISTKVAALFFARSVCPGEIVFVVLDAIRIREGRGPVLFFFR